MLLRWKDALSDEAADGGGADCKNRSRLLDCRLATVGVLALTINGDVVLTPKRANTSPCPAVPATSRLAGSVEQRGDRLVGHLPRQGTDQINDFDIGSPSRLAGAVALHNQTRDRKSTRLNSSHLVISYAVFCLK